MVSSESVDFALDNYLSKCLAYAKRLVITACTGIDVKKNSNSLLYMHGAWRNAGAQIQPDHTQKRNAVDGHKWGWG